MKNKLVAIVIPTHKNELNELEKISFDRAINLFKDYDIYFAIPESLTFSNSIDIEVERFEDVFFSSFSMYNKMMLTRAFYERFSAYKYILIYQLDAFVFSDQLKYFCNLDYDYIGAPWLYGMFRFVNCEHNIWYVGNGGFSLRKIESFIRMLDERKELVNCNTELEDVFIASMCDTNFKVAPQKIALQFSFETDVRKCYEQNNEQLPFGCHAWERYDLFFWKPYIEKFGYSIPAEYLEKGQEDFWNITIENREIYRKREYFWKNIFKKEIFLYYFKNLYSTESDKYVIWGAGHWGQIMRRLLVDVGITVEIIIDRKKGIKHETMEGCPIITPKEYQELNIHSNILVAIWEYDREIQKALEIMGYCYQKDYICVKDIKMYIDYL